MDEVAVILRDFDPERDKSFIYSTWRNGVFYRFDSNRDKHDPDWFSAYTKRISVILETARVRVACLHDCPEVIIGYVVSTGPHLDWIFVKGDYRKMGIASLLWPEGIETVTDELTKIGADIVSKKNLVTKGESNGESTRELPQGIHTPH